MKTFKKIIEFLVAAAVTFLILSTLIVTNLQEEEKVPEPKPRNCEFMFLDYKVYEEKEEPETILI